MCAEIAKKFSLQYHWLKTYTRIFPTRYSEAERKLLVSVFFINESICLLSQRYSAWLNFLKRKKKVKKGKKRKKVWSVERGIGFRWRVFVCLVCDKKHNKWVLLITFVHWKMLDDFRKILLRHSFENFQKKTVNWERKKRLKFSQHDVTCLFEARLCEWGKYFFFWRKV